MRFFEIIQFGFRSLWRYKLRSVLTMLGIVFGIAAVIAMMALGTGAERKIMEEIQKQGINNIIINSIKPTAAASGSSSSFFQKYGLTFKDKDYLEEICGDLREIHPVHQIREALKFGNRQIEARVLGIRPEQQSHIGLNLALGRSLSDTDSNEFNRTALVSYSLLRELNYIGDPLEFQFMLGHTIFQTVGLLASDEFLSPATKSLGMEQPTFEVYVPYETALKQFGTTSVRFRSGTREAFDVELDQLILTVKSAESVLPMARLARNYLQETHPDMDYEIIVPLEQLKQSQQTQLVFNIVVILIASISLLVGGIGIVNIMLATITERTKEVGIRRALGARRGDIMTQFLIETVILTSLGGLAGCGAGVLSVQALIHFTGWRSEITPISMILAIGISCGVGIVFGIYPARRAARMDPITALRHE